MKGYLVPEGYMGYDYFREKYILFESEDAYREFFEEEALAYTE